MKKKFLLLAMLLLAAVCPKVAWAALDIPWESNFTSAALSFGSNDDQWMREKGAQDLNTTTTGYYYFGMSQSNHTGIWAVSTRSNNYQSSYLDRTLIWPVMNFVGGNTYYVEFNVIYNGTEARRYVRLYGLSGDALSTKVVDICDVTLENKNTGVYGFYFKAPAGLRRLAIQAYAENYDGSYGGGLNSEVHLTQFKVENADADLAGKVTDLEATSAAPGVKKATISFKAPTTTISGTPLTDLTKLRIYVDGEVYKDIANPTPGQQYTCDIESNMCRKIDIVVTPFNSKGAGSKAVTECNLGGTMPSTYYFNFGNYNEPYTFHRNVCYALYSPTGVDLKWEKNTSASGYVVYEMPAGVEVVRGTLDDFEEEVVNSNLTYYKWTHNKPLTADQPIARYYQIRYLNSAGSENDYTYSNVLSVGNNLPYLHELKGAGEVMQGNVYSIMLPGDGYHQTGGWQHSLFNGYNYMQCGAWDNWYVLNGMNLKAGKHYRLNLYANTNSGSANVGASLGTSNRLEDQTQEVMPQTLVKALRDDMPLGERYQSYFDVAADGTYFLSVHATTADRSSKSSPQTLNVQRVYIEEVGDDLPGAIGDYTIVFDPNDPTKATVTFVAPDTNLNGEALSSIDKMVILKDNKEFLELENIVPGQSYSFEVSVSATEQFTYYIYGVNDSGSGVGTSIPVFIINAPYSNDFASKKNLAGWTVIDSKLGSSFSWHIQNETARCYDELDNTIDDWLITPPLHLEGGKFYKTSFVTWCDQMYDKSQISMWMGNTPTVDGMDKNIIPTWIPTGANRNEAALLKEYFTVKDTGEYYLGFHGYAESLGEPIMMDDFSVSAPIDARVPGMMADFAVIPEKWGKLTGNVEFTVSPTSIDGVTALTDNPSHVRVYIDGELFTDLGACKSKQHLTVPIAVETEGVHLITVQAENGYGVGREIETVAYFGINRPAAVGNCVALETQEYGTVRIEWVTPETDYDGFPINPELITYDVFRYHPAESETQPAWEESLATGLKGNDLTVRIQDNDAEQTYMRFGVRARTVTGGSPGFLARFISVGAPEQLPWSESFADAHPHMTFMSERTGDLSPSAWGYNRFLSLVDEVVEPHDNDKGLAIMEVMFQEAGNRLSSGKIDLSGAKHPGMTLWVYNYNGNPANALNTISFEARTLQGEWTPLRVANISELTASTNGWMKCKVDLAPFAGEVVYLGFNATCYDKIYTIIDDIRVEEYEDENLVMLPLEVPEAVAPGRDFAITATVYNLGDTENEEYSVSLYNGDKLVATKDCGGLAIGGKARTRFTHVHGADVVGEQNYRAVVYCTSDKCDTDNEAKGVVIVNESAFPGVEALTATQSAPGELTISWQAPVLRKEAERVVEDFESYDPWTNMNDPMGGWKMYDQDDNIINGILINVDGQYYSALPEKVGPTTKQSWFVFDSNYEPFLDNPSYVPHSGGQCLMSMSAYDSMALVEDWLVSPVLSGREQTISFWVKGARDNWNDPYANFFQVYANTEMEITSPSTFSPVSELFVDKHNEWTRYEVTLPEGTQHFAIVRNDSRAWWFLLDDIEYEPGGDERLTTKGFNVYRNGELISKAQRMPSYVEQVPDGTHKYSVSVAYDLGESKLAHVSADSTAIGTLLSADGAWGGQGRIFFGNFASDIEVYAMGGQHLYTLAAGTSELPVAAGVYMVKADGKTFKVIVK